MKQIPNIELDFLWDINKTIIIMETSKDTSHNTVIRNILVIIESITTTY